MNAKTMHTRQSLSRAIRLQSVSRILLGILALLGVLSPSPAQAQDATQLIGGTISIFAGSKDSNASTAYDGVPASNSKILPPNFTALDADGNLYFSYADGLHVAGVSVVYGGNNVPPILVHRVPSPQKGYQYMIAGSLTGQGSGQLCTPPDPCGDGGPALVSGATANPLFFPFGITVDAAGNLYIADALAQSIRKVSAADGKISTIAGDLMHAQFGYSGDGGPATLALLFNPATVKFDAAGNLYVADALNALIRRIDTTGIITSVAGNTTAAATAYANGYPQIPFDCSVLPSTDNCGEGGPPLSATLGYVLDMSFDPNGNLFLAEQDIHVIREIDLSAQSPTIQTVAGTLHSPCSPPSGPNPPPPPYCGDGGAATGPNAQLNNPQGVLADAAGNVVISDSSDEAVRLVTANDGKIQTIAGQLFATGYGGDGGPATAAVLNAPIGLALDVGGNLYLADSNNSLIRQVTPDNRTPQTISYNPPPPQTYGNSLDLDSYFTNTSASGKSFTYQLGTGSPATLNGSILKITGPGTITVTATLSGDSTWKPASKTESISVAPATLTVTGPDNFILQEGQAVPSTIGYKITGFASGDSQSSVLTGAPTVVVVDAKGVPIPAGTVLPAGTYTVKVTQGSPPRGLALTQNYAQDYVFKFVNSSLLVTLGQPQKVTISNFTPPAIYGGPNSSFSFTATASSGLPVDVTFTGPVNTQQTTVGWNVTVAGAGKVTITATQGGNATYAPATTTQSFIVNPATLTITPANVTRPYNTPNPAFTYVATGFVGSDTSAVLTGAPVYSTKATQTSDAGQYFITITDKGTLFAQNYTFVYQQGTLTISPAAQTITFGDVKDLLYGFTETISANSSSGLPVQFTTTGPIAYIQGPSNISINNTTDIGPVTVTAMQPGNQDYAPAAPVTVSFNVVRAPLNVYVSSVTRPVGAPNPTFQYSWQTGLLDPISPPYVTGTPDLSTTATQSSPPGTYTIVATLGTLTAEHYYFVFNNGTLTVTSASSYILTTTPTSMTIPRGSTRQLTVIASPLNNYSGSVTFGCSGLPAGVSCSFSPASLTIPPPDPGSASNFPVQGTLTITASGSSALAEPLEMWRKEPLVTAGFLLVPAGLGGLFLLVGRRRFLKSVRAQSGLALAVLFCVLGALAACGGGGSNSSQATPGTTVIQVTGTGTASDGAADLNQNVSLTLIVQ